VKRCDFPARAGDAHRVVLGVVGTRRHVSKRISQGQDVSLCVVGQIGHVSESILDDQKVLTLKLTPSRASEKGLEFNETVERQTTQEISLQIFIYSLDHQLHDSLLVDVPAFIRNMNFRTTSSHFDLANVS
jgi:hypothetical protein